MNLKLKLEKMTLEELKAERRRHKLSFELESLNKTQAELLKLPWPPIKGWRYAFIGREVSDETWEQVLALRGLSPGKRKKLIRRERQPEFL